MQITPLAIAIGRTTSTRLTARVQNAGPSAAVATRVVLEMPAGLTLVTATPSVGTCSVVGATITCMPGDLANDAEVTIELDVLGAARGVQSVTGSATADALDTNGTPDVIANVNVAAFGDARVQVTESAGGKVAGTAFTYAVLVRNDGPDAMDLTGSLTLTGATATAVSADAGGACLFTTSRAECSFTALPAGGQATMTVTVNASAAGTVTASGLVSVNAIDPVATNNTTALATSVAAPPPPPAPASSGGKGGGGRLDWLLMCALAVILIARERRKVRKFSNTAGKSCRDESPANPFSPGAASACGGAGVASTGGRHPTTNFSAGQEGLDEEASLVPLVAAGSHRAVLLHRNGASAACPVANYRATGASGDTGGFPGQLRRHRHR
jgi:hypothetical protein